MTAHTIDYPGGTTAIDTELGRRRHTAAWLLEQAGRAALIETGVPLAAGRVLAVLEQRGIAREAVDWVFITHIHLDHGGGAGALLAALPNARLVVHPSGARHMVDPSRLMASATAVYGEAVMRSVYGEMVPVDPARLIEAHDGDRFELAGRVLQTLDTPGHARHHYCLWDVQARQLFTGDTFGLCYPELTTERGPFVLPTTTPTQFDPAALRASIERLLALEAEAVCFTHFGRYGGVAQLGADLLQRLDQLVALAEGVAAEATPSIDRTELLAGAIRGWLWPALDDHGCRLDDAERQHLLAMDIELNAQGLACWLERR